MVQDQVNEKSANMAIQVVTKGTKLTGRILAKAFSSIYRKIKTEKNYTGKGKQTLKSLLGQGKGETSAEISGSGKQAFERLARKYGVDYAVRKSPKNADGHTTFTVYVKSADKVALENMMRDYSGKILKRTKQKSKPSLLQELAKAKVRANDIAEQNKDKVREKVKELSR